jgi:cbb3-type cytochrome oxidase subunit 3
LAGPAADADSGADVSFESIDINLVRGIVLILLIIAFAMLWAWAWSRKRKPVFKEASMLPLEEDFGQVPQKNSKTEGIKE